MPEEDEDEETFVVVELPPEARLVAGDELRFVDLGTQHPRLRLPSGAELVGRYEESVGDLLVMQPTTTSDDKQDAAAAGGGGGGGGVSSGAAKLVGKSEVRLRFHRPNARHAAAR